MDGDEGGIDLTGIFLVVVLALALMVVCTPRPRRGHGGVAVVYQRCC